jgi:hypothetical protein
MCRILDLPDISEKQKCMLSGKSSYHLPFTCLPVHDTIEWISGTWISRWYLKKRYHIVIRLIEESIFILGESTPVSPVDHVISAGESFERYLQTLISWERWIGVDVVHSAHESYPREILREWCLMDSISCQESLWAMIWPDELSVRISPYPITYTRRKMRDCSYDTLLTPWLPCDCLDDHTQSCDLTGESISLEDETISVTRIEGSRELIASLEMSIETLGIASERIPLFEHFCYEDMCGWFSEIFIDLDDTIDWWDKSRLDRSCKSGLLSRIESIERRYPEDEKKEKCLSHSVLKSAL